MNGQEKHRKSGQDNHALHVSPRARDQTQKNAKVRERDEKNRPREHQSQTAQNDKRTFLSSKLIVALREYHRLIEEGFYNWEGGGNSK
jgi:hypothetical protein